MSEDLGGKIVVGIAVLAAVIIVTTVVSRKAQSRANKAFNEKYDEIKAKELSGAFEEAMDEFPLEVKQSVRKFKQSVNELCADPRFNIEPVFA